MKASRVVAAAGPAGRGVPVKGLSGELASVPGVTFFFFGTSPNLDSQTGTEAHQFLKVTSGSGTPAIADNNIVITFAQAPTKVWLCVRGNGTPMWHADVSGSTVRIGSKVAPLASTQYSFEIITEF